MQKCPACSSASTRKSRKQSSKRLPPAWHQAAYRCDTCGHRFLATDSPRLALWAAAFAALVAMVLVPLAYLGDADIEAQLATMQAEAMSGGAGTQSGEFVSLEALRAAAESGDPESQYQLAIVLLEKSESRGDFATRDSALQLLQASASSGFRQAQRELAERYMAGIGVVQNFAQAANWYQLAARQGDAVAMYNLGNMARSGWGMDESVVDSYVWLNLASARGEARADELRTQIMKQMTTDQIHDAQDRARDLDQTIPRL